MCRRICIMQYKDVIILLCLTIFKICKWKILALDFQLKVCLKGNRDVISSDLLFMKWHVHCPVGVINIEIEPTAHRCVFTVRPQKNYFLFSCYTLFSWKFNAKFKSEKRLKKLKIERVRTKKLIKNIKKFKSQNLVQFFRF